MKKITLAILAISLFHPALRADDSVVGFQRLTGTPAEDTKAWDGPARFTNVDLSPSIAFSGDVDIASGSEISTIGAFWRVGQFVYSAGDQPKHFYVEITSGTAAGTRFDISANDGNSVSVDLNGGSFAGISQGDGMQIVAKWSLDQLFPEGNGLTPSALNTTGSEVLFPATASEADFASAATYQYRSDLVRWVNTSDTGTDAGDDIIAHGALLVIRQSGATPIQPLFAGHFSSYTPLKVTVRYLQTGNDDFSNALSITDEGSIAADTTGASGETGEPMHAGNGSTASVWFEYTAGQTGNLLVNSEHSGFDTVLAAYTGVSVDALTLLASNDDLGMDSWSQVSFPISSGQTYYIALDGKAGAVGAAALLWEIQTGFPEITVEQPVNTNLVDGNSTVDFGEVLAGSDNELTFTIRNQGGAQLTGLNTSVSGTNDSDYLPIAPQVSSLNPGESTTFTVEFQASGVGARTATLQITSNDADENPFDITLTGVTLPATTLESWGMGYGLSGNELLPGADDDGDKVTLIEEYAYNMDPTQSDPGYLTPGTGTSGLPLIRLIGDKLQVEWLRRKSDASLTATAQFSATLPGGFAESPESETVTSIDSDFERVAVSDSQTTSASISRFGKVVLEQEAAP